jgi:hypothetical protein
VNADPMVPLVTGYLMGKFPRDGDGLFRVVRVEPDPPGAFRVEFASGLVLRVVTLVEREPGEANLPAVVRKEVRHG